MPREPRAAGLAFAVLQHLASIRSDACTAMGDQRLERSLDVVGLIGMKHDRPAGLFDDCRIYSERQAEMRQAQHPPDPTQPAGFDRIRRTCLEFCRRTPAARGCIGPLQHRAGVFDGNRRDEVIWPVSASMPFR